MMLISSFYPLEGKGEGWGVGMGGGGGKGVDEKNNNVRQPAIGEIFLHP
jgi:hypothetical protein